MSHNIEFTPSAEETFQSIVAQLKDKWGEQVVIDLENRILKNLEIIAVNPFIYPLINERFKIRRCVLHKNCSILYTLTEDSIVVLCFWDNRQEPVFDL